jgi:hypothetical protein
MGGCDDNAAEEGAEDERVSRWRTDRGRGRRERRMTGGDDNIENERADNEIVNWGRGKEGEEGEREE